MAKPKAKTLENRTRFYRLALHNTDPNPIKIKEMVEEELNTDVKIVGWEVENIIDYKAHVGDNLCKLPQRETLVMVRYQEYL